MIALASWLRRGPAPLLGIDISSTSLKLVELGRSGSDVLQLLHCAMEPLERGSVVDGTIQKFDEVADAMRRLLRKAGTRTKRIALALPGSSVITRKVCVPSDLDEVQLELQVESEAAQLVPSPLSEVALDFCVIGPSSVTPGYQDVLVAATRKERVENYQELAQAAGLQLVILDIEPHAARLAARRAIDRLPQGDRNPVVALFSIGSQSTALQVVRGDDLLYERDQAIGGDHLTQTIERHYGLAREEAELRKRQGGAGLSDYSENILLPFLDTLGRELGRALQFFFTSTPYKRVDHILLAGGGANLPGLAAVVERQTGFAASVLNPFDGMVASPLIPASRLAAEATSYLIAVGLALRRFR